MDNNIISASAQLNATLLSNTNAQTKQTSQVPEAMLFLTGFPGVLASRVRHSDTFHKPSRVRISLLGPRGSPFLLSGTLFPHGDDQHEAVSFLYPGNHLTFSR